MNEALINIGIVVFIAYAAFSIAEVIELRRTSRVVRRFVEKTEEDLHPTIASARKVLDDMATATHNIAELSRRVREVTETLTRLERSMRELFEYYKDSLGEAAEANIAGLKAGVRAGVVTLLKDLNERKEGSS